jgi:hypothetical protein
MRLSEQDGIGVQMNGEHIISGESSRPHVIAEIVEEPHLQVRDSGEKGAEHTTGEGNPILAGRTATIVRWVGRSGKLRKTLGFRNGEQSRGE